MIIDSYIKNCTQCNAQFSKPSRYSKKQWEGKTFCSNQCSAVYKGKLMRGKPTWNKGTKGLMQPNKTSWKKNDSRISGENHRQWGGEYPTYATVHKWISKKLGKPSRCDYCRTEEIRMYHWSNISGKYRRDATDWWRLCVPCHSLFDKGKIQYLNSMDKI